MQEMVNDPRPLPFEDLLRPVVLTARNELRRRIAPDTYRLLTWEAHAGWEQYLLSRLAWISAKAAHWQFQVYKTVSQVFSAKPQAESGGSDDQYCAFIGTNPEERLEKLLKEFPGLDRFHDLLVANWLAAVEEFLERLNQDREELGTRFAGGSSLVQVEAIDAGLSDPHCGGRCVARFTFTQGTQIIYKPRSVAAEDHFSDLIDEVNSGAIPHSLKSARCWDRHDYGWMENFVTLPCSDLAEVHAFYWRAGALLCLIYLAQGVDIHQQNMIAAGRFPVLVDLEALLHPQDDVVNRTSVDPCSVLRTGFLPVSSSGVGLDYEWSALNQTPFPQYSAPGWVNVNRDNMLWAPITRSMEGCDNLPQLNGRLYPAGEFVSDIQAGFRWIGDRFTTSSTFERTFSRWLVKLNKCPRRRLRRSTAFYYRVRERSSLPAFLRNSIQDARSSAGGDGDLDLNPEESQAIQQLDIPYLVQARTDEDPAVYLQLMLSKETLHEQERVISAALTTPTESIHSATDAVNYQGGKVVQSTM